MIVGYLTSFGAIVLHNGTTKFHMSLVSQPIVATVRYVTLGSGALYDMDSGTAPIPPAPFNTDVLLKGSSPANLQTMIDELVGAVGTKGTLSATQINTVVTKTCTARLESMTPLSLNKRAAHQQAKFRLSWKPLTNWS